MIHPARSHVQAYEALEARFARISAIEGALGILHWDTRTMMPEGSAHERANQIATLTSMAHELLTSSQTDELLDEADNSRGELDAWQLANMREMRRILLHGAAVPTCLIGAISRASSHAEMVWREARRNSDFALLLPHLTEVLRLRREVGKAKGEALGLSAASNCSPRPCSRTARFCFSLMRRRIESRDRPSMRLRRRSASPWRRPPSKRRATSTGRSARRVRGVSWG